MTQISYTPENPSAFPAPQEIFTVVSNSQFEFFSSLWQLRRGENQSICLAEKVCQ